MNAWELSLALLFYGAFSLFAAIGLSAVKRVVPNKILAYAASKPAGLVMFGYVVWLSASFRWLDYQNRARIILLFLLASGAGLFHNRRFLASEDISKRHRCAMPFYKQILIIEGVALIVYLSYLYIRSFNPAINGTERFMDMALLTSAGKTHYFPFWDAWYAGKTVNYYYYGSYLMSLLANISGVQYSLSYNFALGLIYCETALLSAALVFTITGSKVFSLLSSFFVTTSGTLFFAGCQIGAALAGRTCSYASSTRLFTPSYIINEIPSYSFTVGDLHAHLLGLPFFVFDLILIYAFATARTIRWRLLALIALSIASSGMINAWDAVTLSVLFGVLVLAKTFESYLEVKDRKIAALWLLGGAATVAGALLLMVPNLLYFHSPILGVGFARAYAASRNMTNVQYPTPLLAELGMWGTFWIGILSAFIWKWRELREHLFLVALAFVSLGIVIGVELFVVKDIYSVANPPYFRANTTFKFGYHAWVMLALAFCVALNMLWRPSRSGFGRAAARAAARSVAVVVATVAVAGGVFYPYQAVQQFYLPGPTHGELDGALWMRSSSPGDWETVNYINNTFPDRAVIAEAVGDSYTTFARISTYTGMITPMGWKTHEWTWRLDASAARNVRPGLTVETGWGAISKVALDIQRLYETKDQEEAHKIIETYGIQYIYVGDLERRTYKDLEELKFSSLGKEVFRSGSSVFYSVL